MTERTRIGYRTEEFGAMIGVDALRVQRWCVAGTVRAEKIGGEWVIDAADVERRFQRSEPVVQPPTPKTRRSIKLEDRFAILVRDGFRCRYCGATAKEARLVVDHVTSVADGGTNEPDNLATACFECNAGKGRLSLPAAP